jgi:hypothetical protein
VWYFTLGDILERPEGDPETAREDRKGHCNFSPATLDMASSF